MSGFNLRISGVGGDRFANYATTTAYYLVYSVFSDNHLRLQMTKFNLIDHLYGELF